MKVRVDVLPLAVLSIIVISGGCCKKENEKAPEVPRMDELVGNDNDGGNNDGGNNDGGNGISENEESTKPPVQFLEQGKTFGPPPPPPPPVPNVPFNVAPANADKKATTTNPTKKTANSPKKTAAGKGDKFIPAAPKRSDVYSGLITMMKKWVESGKGKFLNEQFLERKAKIEGMIKKIEAALSTCSDVEKLNFDQINNGAVAKELETTLKDDKAVSSVLRFSLVQQLRIFGITINL